MSFFYREVLNQKWKVICLSFLLKKQRNLFVSHLIESSTSSNIMLNKIILLLSLQISLLGTTFGGNVLIWPMEGSHWLNVKIIIDELIKKGHNVTVLVASGALFITPTTSPSLIFEIYEVPFSKERIEGVIKDFVLTWMEHRPSPLTIWRFYQEMAKVIKDFHMVSREICDGVLKNEKLMEKLKKSKFEVLVSDPVFPCGDIIALKLGIPFIYSLRFSPASTVEKHCGKVPYPPSYVPAILSELTDQMSFTDRVRNFISYHLQDYMFNTLWQSWDSYYSNALGMLHFYYLSLNRQSFVSLLCFPMAILLQPYILIAIYYYHLLSKMKIRDTMLWSYNVLFSNFMDLKIPNKFFYG